jgi:hypothetical protein
MRGHDLQSPSAQGELHPAARAESPADPSPARVEAFSDGVFAFGVTLLILGIRIPHPTDADSSAGLLTLLGQQWRSYLVYALSFMFVGNNWINHRTMFSKFVRTNHALVWLNLVYLMVAGAFIPLPQPSWASGWAARAMKWWRRCSTAQQPRSERCCLTCYGGTVPTSPGSLLQK